MNSGRGGAGVSVNLDNKQQPSDKQQTLESKDVVYTCALRLHTLEEEGDMRPAKVAFVCSKRVSAKA